MHHGRQAGKRGPETRTMRFDLLPERDRFIPGWYPRPEPASLRAEYTQPEWRWPSRLYRVLQASLSSLIQARRAALGPRSGLPETSTQIGNR